jgi:TolA-binding protein
VVCIVALSPGCWIAQNTSASSDLHRTVSAAGIRVAQAEQQLADSERRIQQLEETIRLQGQSQASRLDNIDEVNAEVARLRGQIEVMQFEMSEVRELMGGGAIDGERRHLHAESRLSKIEGFLAIAPPPPPTDAELGLTGVLESPDGLDAESDPTSEPEPVEVPETAEGKLQLATAHLEAGRNAVARVVLKAAMDEHLGSDEMAEIRYRFAEAWFNEQNWIKAATSFKSVTDNHPKSDWSCWAMFRQGECFDSLRQPENARLFYEGAIQGRCGRSAAAKEARAKL